MKRRRLSRLFALLALFALLPMASLAVDFEVNGIAYNKLTSTTCEVTMKDGGYEGSITVPSTVTYGGTTYTVTAIGDEAFNGEKHYPISISSISLPETIKSIGNKAFCWCSAMLEITLPSSLETIGTEWMNYTNIRRIISLNSVPPTGGAVYSPERVVLYVPDGALEAYKNASNWNTAYRITEGDGPFQADGFFFDISSAQDLTCEIAESSNSYSGKVTVPETVVHNGKTYTVTGIGMWGFLDKSGITELDLPKSITYINAYGLAGSTGLTSITVRALTPPTLGEGAFNGIKPQTINVYPSALSAYQAADGWKDLATIQAIEGEDLIDGIHYSILSESDATVQVVGPADKSLTTVTIPQSITMGGKNYAVTKVGDSAFSGCTSLTSISLPSTLQTIGSSAFYGCSGLKSVVIPDAVKTIADNAFYGCSALADVTLGTGVTKLDDRTFALCYALKSITLPANITGVNFDAFYDAGIESITMLAPTAVSVSYATTLSGLSLANLTLSVPYATRASYKSSDSWKSVGALRYVEAFDVDGVTYVPNEDGTTCTLVTNYNGWTADVVIPASVTRTTTGEDNTEVQTTYAVTAISDEAFTGATELTAVTIPASVTTIATGAFSGCTALTSVTALSETPATLADYVFDINEGMTLYVPMTAGTAYAGATNWFSFSNIKPINGSEFTAGSVRYRLTSTDPLTCEVIALGDEEKYTGEVTVPASLSMNGFDIAVTKVGDNAFSGCQSLTSVSLPEGITAIGKDAFFNCNSLTPLPIPATVETIDEGAYNGCTKVDTYVIPASVKSIGTNAFANIYPASVTVLAKDPIEITEDAFNGYTADWTIVTLYVPYGSKSAYAAATGWKNFAAISYAAGTQFEADGLCYEMTGANDCKVIAPYEGSTADYAQLTEVNIPETVSDGLSVTAIDKEVCKGLSIRKVTIPSTVTSIGESAFEDCAELTDVTIAAKASISAFAFKNSGLTSLKLLGSEVIDYDHVNGDVFLGVKDFSVYVPVGMKKAYKEAQLFAESKLHYVENTFTADGVRYQVTGEDETTCSVIALSEGKYTDYVYIRNTVTDDELTVTAIGEKAFNECGELSIVKLPSTLQTIGNAAFMNCKQLMSISIPDAVTTIEPNAFKYCSNLTSVDFEGTGLTKIDDSVFGYCKALTHINLPASITELHNYAFYSSGLNRLTLRAPSAVTISGGTTLGGISIEGLTITVPYTTRAGYKASDNWKTVGALRYMDTYEQDGVTYVPNEDGTNCTLVTKYNGWSGDVVIPASVTRTTTGEDGTEVQTTYPVTAISDEAFTNATALTSVTIPASVTSIATGAFTGCTALTSITVLGETPATLEADAFSAYTAELAVPEGALDTYKAAEVWKNFTNIFENITYFEVDNIAYNVLSRDDKTVEVTRRKDGYGGTYTVPETVSYKDVAYTVTEIADSAFADFNITAVNLPNTVTKIGDYAFCNSYYVGAFTSSSNLKSFTVPASVKSIGNYAFAKNIRLENITILSESLDFLGKNAFGDSESEHREIVGYTVTISMPYCTTPPVAQGALATDEKLGYTTLLVPYPSIEAYKSAEHWSGFSSIDGYASFTYDGFNYKILSYDDKTCEVVSADSNNPVKGDLVIPSTADYFGEAMKVTSIGNYAFWGNKELVSVTIPEGVTKIGAEAFEECNNLKTVNLSEGLQTIKDYAFRYCYPIESIYLPNTVTTLGGEVFALCTSLKDLHLSTSLTSMDDGTLKGLTSLKELELPASLSVIENWMFDGTTNVEK